MPNMPIIRLELQQMKHTLMVALSEYTAQMDKDIQQVVNAYCTEDHLLQVIAEAVKSELDRCVKEEIRKFFEYGDGNAMVRELVREQLKRR